MEKGIQELVSVIVPVYNCEVYIEQCINSILDQTYQNLEVIAIDDGSPDSSGKILDSIKEKDSRINVIHKENEGVSVARNIGLKEAKGKYVLFVDGDDYVHPEYVSYMVGLITSNNSEMAISSVCRMGQNEGIINDDTVYLLTSDQALALFLSPTLIVGCWNKIYDRKFLLSHRLFFNPDLFYGEGLHFICRTAQELTSLTVGNRNYYNYRRNNNTSATYAFSISKISNGQQSLDLIEQEIESCSSTVREMLNWHKCQFKLGSVVKILEGNAKAQYSEIYEQSLKYVRTHWIDIVKMRNIGLYNKAIIVGCAISPTLLSKLFSLRKKILAKRSVN